MRIAVVGTGIAGSLAARILASSHEVAVFEAASYVGGHANTVDVEIQGRHYPVDTGFMVFNNQTYPNFCRLLELIEISSQPSDMSFSVQCRRTGLEYQGSSPNGIFAQRKNLLSPRFLTMLADIWRFNRAGMLAANSGELSDQQSVGEFLAGCNVGRAFLDHYFIPMAAAIWSSTPQSVLDFPARFMIGFFANHGLMQLKNRPQWRTILGGSRKYVHALLEPIFEKVRLNSPVERIERDEDGVTVVLDDGSSERFEEVVLACHSDQSLRMLANPTPAEREVLSSIAFHSNTAVLHTDASLLPRARRAWASWNYHIDENGRGASVTYDVSRLQNHESPTPILVTLNPTQTIAAHKVIRTFSYHHPAYSLETMAAQNRYSEINNHQRTHYCGAYWGYGFHEDGVNSALSVVRNFGLNLDSCIAVSTRELSVTGAARR
ncbi:MAG: FAD-dependent oxidoreductase [Pirellulaceae bacterium]